MRDLPQFQLDPKIKNVWRINDAVWLTVVFLICFVPFLIAALAEPASWILVVLVVEAVAFVAALVVWLAVLPPIRYARWRYELSEDYLDIAKGIVLAQALHHPIHTRTEHRHAPRPHPARLRPVQRHGGHGRRRACDSRLGA